MDLEDGYLPQHGSIKSLDIRRVEFSQNLMVTPMIPIESTPQPGWGEWSNDPKDASVIYMEGLIAEKYKFSKGVWPGGVTSEPLLKKPKDRCQRNEKKDSTPVKQSLKPKRSIKKEASSRKQRRISSYFTRSSVNTFTNAQLTEIVLGLQKQMKQICRLLKKKKSHGRQGSFHTLISRCKKHGTSRCKKHVEPEAPFEEDVPETHDHDVEPQQFGPLDSDQGVDAMETDQQTEPRSGEAAIGKGVDDMEAEEHPEPQSPIISQYAAHLHRQASESINESPGSLPDCTETIHEPNVHDDVDHNQDNVHIPSVHGSEYDQQEPVHIEGHNANNYQDDDDIPATPAPEKPKDEFTKTPAHEEPEEEIHRTPPRVDTNKCVKEQTFGILHPGRWDPPSIIYDKADHPNSPEISHILNHGLRIFERISPDPPLSNPPIFDSTIGPSSPPGIRLRLSPLSFTPLTSPVKNSDTGLGFANHSTTPNAFKATASSTSPPCIGRPTEENLADKEGVVDLTRSKDPPRHVPSLEENHLAKELFSSPLVPALAIITPLPELEWELFQQIMKANINV
ncbi:hypothetical protein Bca101_080585 [Brassica carinata]